MSAAKVTPEQALADLAATAKCVAMTMPTKAAQKEWHEQWVARDGAGKVVFAVKTWNPCAEDLARGRAERIGGTVELVGEGRRPA